MVRTKITLSSNNVSSISTISTIKISSKFQCCNEFNDRRELQNLIQFIEELLKNMVSTCCVWQEFLHYLQTHKYISKHFIQQNYKRIHFYFYFYQDYIPMNISILLPKIVRREGWRRVGLAQSCYIQSSQREGWPNNHKSIGKHSHR